MSSERKSQGRQKIEMKKMSNESNLQVTFSRRRRGLFKKASELSTLCDAKISLVVFSPSEKFTKINNTLDIKKKLGDELSHLRKEFEAQFCWTCSIDKMNWAQLEMFKKDLEELRNLVAQHAINLVIQDTHTQTLPFCVESVSPSNIPFQHQLIPQQGQMFPP
ncbi:unnamed protein product [Vicia faba]|uniref:MADS-box domain-containing protein n=1 Tax=Vicia faba TaxID=3906 RepID=A0AAV0ZJX2_VICFA|nr:unnamed protein product [Vicia faba]